MSTRRSTRLRRKPTPVYQVEDTRPNADEVDGDAETHEAPQDAEDAVESSSDEGQEGDDEEFHPLKTKPKTPKKTRTPTAKPKPDTAAESDDDGDADISLFEEITRGKKPLENLLTEWRDRFEADEEPATREVLNFVLQACGGTGQCVPEDEPLAQLEMGDLVDHVVEDLEKANGDYPIASRAKGMKKFHRSFEDFWEVFVKECYESEILFASEVATNFVDWLTTLSSSEIRAIRHTSTIAALALSNALVSTAAAISDQFAIAIRQLNAETISPSIDAARKNPNVRKVALLKENKTLYEGRLQQVLKLVNLVFTGVVVHRYRDVMPEIRVAAMQCLGHWITTMPDHFLKDNFLKYLGWLLNDKAVPVRLEVVQILCELYEHDAFTERLELFTSRFLPRYLELCDDVDAAVVQECIHLLIAVDKCNLISSDIELQPVEKLVFDPDHEDIRKAAAEFVCLQYDAFGVAVSKVKDAKLKKEQLNTQAIALVEFAEEYIQHHAIPDGAVETLVDAFWGLDDCLVLQDWRVMTNLLLVDKSAPDLSSEQQTILLRLLVASIRKMVGNEAHGSAKKENEDMLEEITVAYCKDIPNLFMLYQADSDKLSLLLQLIPMLTLKAEVIGHHSGNIKGLLEKLKLAYLVHSDEDLLTSLSLSVSHLLHTEHVSLKREAELIVRELIQEVLDKLDQLLVADAELYDTLATTGEATPTTRSRKTKGRKKKNPKAKEISDVEYGLRISLCRLKCLIRYLDIRKYLLSEITLSTTVADGMSTSAQHVGRMDGLIAAVGDLLRRRTKTVMELDEGFRHADTIKHGLMILYSDLLWITGPIFKSIENDKKRDGSSAIADEAADAEIDPSIQSQIQKVCQSRAMLEEVLISILEMHLAKRQKAGDDKQKEDDEINSPETAFSMEELVFEDENVASYVKEAQRFAFFTFCDARCLFVETFQDAAPPFNTMEWTLPKVLVLLTQMHFENEMEEADEEEPEFENDGEEDNGASAEKADAIRAWEERQQQKAELLVALGRVSLCNPSKKHQAAVVLQYFTSSGKSTVEVVKSFGKRVKTDAPVRYLEIQMTALRQMFNLLLMWKQDLDETTAKENLNEEEMSEQVELKEKVERCEQELKELARRFSQSLGVGKIAPSLRSPFLRFLREGVRYALQQPAQLEFLEAMRGYLSHLDKPSMVQLREYFMERLNALSEIPDDSEGLDPRWRAVFDFQSSIGTTSLTNGRKRTSVGVLGSPPLKNQRRSASSEPTPLQRTSIAEEEELVGENEDSANVAEKDAGGEQNEVHTDHKNRQLTSPGRTAIAEDRVARIGSVVNRKRQRPQHDKQEAKSVSREESKKGAYARQFQEDGKSEEDSPPHSDPESLTAENTQPHLEDDNHDEQHEEQAEEDRDSRRSKRRRRA
ncbi:hypothetical protein PHYBOEH_004839 [Phytophthora boehmeriae]|uniref:SCD domain-containing protein n=1 Tax=Phytophthora boehmeriae TaxID=109152 RepID=A0A8T1WS07_9STRA|nr:hypothetical protein PHYBOEH_004839 [Phytophthora boehmeriae]